MSYQGGNLWSASWDAGTASQTHHVLAVSATDATGRTSMEAVDVMVSAAGTPSNIALDSPTEGETVSGVVSVSGLISDQDGLRAVRIYIDSALRSEIPLQGTTRSFSWAWDTSQMSNGQHCVRLYLYDQAYHSAWTDSVHVTVLDALADTPPSISLLTPTNGQAISGEVEVKASAADDLGLTRIVFRYRRESDDAWTAFAVIDPADMDNLTTPFPTSGLYAAQLQTSALINGSYSLQAVAYDTATYVQTATATASITVQNTEPMPPIVVTGTIAVPWSDHYQINGLTDQFTDQILIGSPFHAGFHFTGLDIPRNATTVSSTLTLTNLWYQTSSCCLRIEGELHGNPENFLGSSLAFRPRTTASVIWTIPHGVASFGTSPDLRNIIQEIVSLPDWRPGSKLALFITSAGTGTRAVNCYEGNRAKAARLNVSYVLAPH